MAPTSFRRIHLAWTFDDGPTVATPAMVEAMGHRPATWFIMRDRLAAGAGDAAHRAILQGLVAAGHEIAIHSSHPSETHVAWFPVKVASAVPRAYDSMGELFVHLESFTAWLSANGLPPKFVRLPGGEISEVMAYLATQGVPKPRAALAQRILRQEDTSNESPGVRRVARDYDALRSKLDELELKVWGGSAAGPLLRSQSWEAESSGGALTNDAWPKFRGLVAAFSTVKRERSLIILAHDTTRKNAEQVARDIAAMEEHAAANDVEIVYHTKSSLYRKVRGVAP